MSDEVVMVAYTVPERTNRSLVCIYPANQAEEMIALHCAMTGEKVTNAVRGQRVEVGVRIEVKG